MAAFDYARPKATADRLIARYGQSATLRRPTSSGTAYNPTEGEPDDHPVTVVVTDYSNREIDGTRVLATDKKVLLAVDDLAITPTPADKLLIGGVSHSIVSPVRPLAPGGTVLYYELQVRR
jgi:hypothetical protein